MHPSLVPPRCSCVLGLFTSECANAKIHQCILKLYVFTHTMLRFLCMRMMLIATFRHTPCLTSKDTVGGGKASLIRVYHPKSILYCCYIWYMGERMGEEPHADPFNEKNNRTRNTKHQETREPRSTREIQTIQQQAKMSDKEQEKHSD